MNPSSRLDGNWRLMWLGAALLVWAAAIFAKLVSLQIIHHNTYVELAGKQQEHAIDLTAPRGTILDRNGKPLAMSVPAESVALNPRLVPDKGMAAEMLAPILNLDASQLYAQIVDASDRHRGFLFVKRKLSREESERLHGLAANWILFQEESQRIYPNNEIAASAEGLGTMGVAMARL